MEQGQKLDFLLGAMSPCGFVGYFDQMLAPRGEWNSLLIKAGPGCGKSTMMTKIADALVSQGETVELIHCSSDPDSLDGVFCAARKFSIVDATAPHTLEPRYPVAGETVISLYDNLDQEKLRSSRKEIGELFDRCSVLQERACRYITAAGSLVDDSYKLSVAGADLGAARSFAARLALKYFPSGQRDPDGGEELRMLSANTLAGPICYTDTISKVADQIIILMDPWGAVSSAMLRILREKALARGLRTITCYCPMAPHDKIDHLLLPSARVAFVTDNQYHPLAFEGARRIHCDRFCDKSQLRAHRGRLRFNRKAAADLLEQATRLQAQAKQHHDQLETYYKAAADFEGVDRRTEEILRRYC